MNRSFLKLALASLIALPLLSACVTTEAPEHQPPSASVSNLQTARGPEDHMAPKSDMGVRGPMGEVRMSGEGPMGGPHMMAPCQGRMQGMAHHPHHRMMRDGKPCPMMQEMMAKDGKPCKCPCAEMAKKPVKKAAKKVVKKPAAASAETAPKQ